MCGIIYSESFEGKPVNGYIFDQYIAQKHRGQEGFGVFDGVNNHMVHAAKESRLVNWLAKPKNESSLLLMHHRFPTSTINVRQAAHPFSTKAHFGDTQYILVHNGSVRNADELFVAHQELGIDYYSFLQDNTFNDSEALLWDFALTMEGKQKKMAAYGGIAFICLKLEKGKVKKMYFARNTNPLNMLRDEQGIVLSSEGEGAPIDQHVLHTWNYELKRLTKRKMQIDSYQYNNSGFNAKDYEYKKPIGALGTGNNWNYRNTWEDDYLEDEEYYPYADSNYGNYPRWVPENVVDKFDKYLKKKHAKEQTQYLNISNDDVMKCSLEYLTAAHGHFEEAYWRLENDYTDLVEEIEYNQSFEKNVELKLLERTLDYVSNDPDYTDETSISSEWEAIWQQQHLV